MRAQGLWFEISNALLLLVNHFHSPRRHIRNPLQKVVVSDVLLLHSVLASTELDTLLDDARFCEQSVVEEEPR